MTTQKIKIISHLIIQDIRLISLIISLIMLGACAVGRSWDTYTYYKEPKGTAMPNLTGITIYVLYEAELVKKALSQVPKQEIGNYTILEKEGREAAGYPVLKISYGKNISSLNYIAFPLMFSSLPSFLSFSIIPAYYYVPDETSFQLILPSGSSSSTTEISYARKRHTFLWFPFVFGFNYIDTVQSFTEPKPTQSQVEEERVRQFFRDSKQAFDAYRASQGIQEKLDRDGVNVNSP